MKSRRGFIAALTAVSGATALPMVAARRAAGAAPAVAPPKPNASAAALAFAATFRAFDAALSDAELQQIAVSIDGARKAANQLRSKSRPLNNSDEMVVRFAADESV